jgi:hypothetical protein
MELQQTSESEVCAVEGCSGTPRAHGRCLYHHAVHIKEVQPMMMDIMGFKEVADCLGVTRSRATELVQRRNFPLPIVQLAATPVWDGAAVRNYHAKRNTHPGRPTGSPNK